MGKRSELSEGIRGQIVLLHSQGKSERNIAKILKCSRGAVQLTLKRHKTFGSLKSRCRTGRKKKTTAREDRMISRMALENRRKSSLSLSHDLAEATGANISARTVRRRLTKCGLKGCKARKKPWLSEKNMKKRLEWAIRHKDWTSAEWSKVIWSDESNFEIFGTPGVTYVRRRPGEAFLPACVLPTVKFGGGSVMIWGCMAAEGPGEMFLCEGRLNSKKYIEVLEACYDTSVNKIFPNEDKSSILFQQDNAPCHTARHTKEWLVKNKVRILEWPAQSPDLNPIENLWVMLKRRVRTHGVTSKKHLKEVIALEWSKITQADCEKLVGNMKKRITEVIKAKGAATKY